METVVDCERDTLLLSPRDADSDRENVLTIVAVCVVVNVRQFRPPKAPYALAEAVGELPTDAHSVPAAIMFDAADAHLTPLACEVRSTLTAFRTGNVRDHSLCSLGITCAQRNAAVVPSVSYATRAART